MNREDFQFPEGAIKAGSMEERILSGLQKEKMPRHIAIIMDGNGRWARKRGMPRVMGHREGVKSVRAAVENCARLGLDALTIYAFSTENWSRPQKEVDALMNLLSEWLWKEVDNLVENNIRFRPIGRWRELPEKVVADLEMAVERTSDGQRMLFQVALNYGGRAELVDSFRSIAAASNGDLRPETIDEKLISKHMYGSDVVDPDLLIRTSGENRISNFLLWEIAYTEIYVTPTFWPDFRLHELLRAIEDYQGRNRRFGGLNGTS